MTKQGNFTQRTPQAKKKSDQASRQISKQASGSASTPHDLVFTAMGPSLGTTQTTATITSTEGLQRATFTTPPQTNLDTHENNDRRISVRDRLGSRDVHSRLGQRRSPSESPPSSDSEDSRRKRRRRVSSSLEDSSDNEDAETGHWKSKNKYREDEDEDMSRPWRRQKVDAFTRRISDFSEDKKRRMPANVKTYDGTELRRAFRLNFTQRKKCAKNPVELARVKQRQGESTSAYVERYKDECIHVKACPEILKISGFMNGINNPELIKRLNDRVPQTFDELMKRTRSFIQGEAAAADSRKGYSNNRPQEQSRRQQWTRSSSATTATRFSRGAVGERSRHPTDNDPKEDTRNEVMDQKELDGSGGVRGLTDLTTACPQDCFLSTRDRLESGVLMRIPLQVLPGCIQGVPIQVSRQVTPLVQNTQEVYEEGDFRWTTEAEEAFKQTQA
ncbi:hypothetical protein Tco_1166359 [Tanacetum coccineum]